jgi:glycosyltransferase involved in cell wall biosynthesis
LDTIGGAESVLLDLLALYPDAEINTLWADKSVLAKLEIEAKTSFLQYFPKSIRRIAGLPLMPLAWRLLSKSIGPDDIQITSSWVFAHSAIPKRYENRSLHYVHTPARYWWTPEIDSRSKLKIPKLVLSIFRYLDKSLARNHLNVVGNSSGTSARVKSFWGIECSVVHPGVDTDFYNYEFVENLGERENFLLCVGRFVPYKGHDKAIALGESLNLPVVLVGHGPGEEYLRNLAGGSRVQVSVQNSVSRETLRRLYASCNILVYPAIEDFGIVAAEALSCGAQVLGISTGGLVDSITSSTEGILVSDTSVETLVVGFKQIQRFSRGLVRRKSLEFSRESFSSKIRNHVQRIEQN